MKIRTLTYLLLVFGLFSNYPVFGQEELQNVKQDSIIPSTAANSFEQNFFKALSERGIENYDKAVEILNAIEKENKEEPVIYFQLGLNHFELENYDLALLNLEKADVLKPKDYAIREAIFKVYEQQKKYTQAIDIAQKLADKNAEYHEILANLYLITAQYQKALNALNTADLDQGFDAHKDKLRGIIFDELNTPEIAIEYYRNRIEQEPYNPLNRYRLVQFQIENQSYQEAISSVQDALENHPRYSRYFVQQTQIYTLIDEKNKALEALKNVVTDRFLEEKYKVEAINYFKSYMEDHPEAQTDFVEILNLASQVAEDNSSFLDLGLYYFESDKARSLENFKKAKDQNPQDFQILKYISVLHYQLNQYQEAIKTSNEALEIYPTQAIFMLVKGQSLVQQTQYNVAKSVLLEALSYVFEENEMMQKLYESLSQVYKGLNETTTAERYANKAKAIESKLK